MERPDVGELSPPDRLLMGPGPSEVHPRVLRAMSTPLVGHLDPAFIDVMDEVQDLIRYAFRTENEFTIPVSGTGSASMESAVANLLEPGDTALIADNGYFGDRMTEMARRAGADVKRVTAPWGEPLAPADVRAACADHEPDLVGFVHAETSTGVRQDEVPAIAEAAHDHGALVLADCVTSLGGVEFRMDEWGVDAAYSGPQKCLSCPPGASPLSLNERAMERIQSRDSPVRSWYLDCSLVADYWGDDRAYHHTAPITNVYALREALRLVAEEGIEARWERHERVASALRAGIEAMGLEPVVDREHWLPSLTTVRLPGDVDPGEVTGAMLDEHGVEVAGGLGAFAGEAIRIGCMGHGARPGTITTLLGALGDVLDGRTDAVDPAAGLTAARAELRGR